MDILCTNNYLKVSWFQKDFLVSSFVDWPLVLTHYIQYAKYYLELKSINGPSKCDLHLIPSLLKVSKSQNKFMKSSFLPKYEQNILKISALATKKWLNQKLCSANYVK